MKFLHYEHYFITTKLSPDEVMSRLRENVITRSHSLNDSGIKTIWPFKGFFIGNCFEIEKITWYINSFSPVIGGIIEPADKGTRVDIKMKMRGFVVIFLVCWIAGVTEALVVAINEIAETGKFQPLIILMIAMWLLGYGGSLAIFKYDSSKSKKILSGLLDAFND